MLCSLSQLPLWFYLKIVNCKRIIIYVLEQRDPLISSLVSNPIPDSEKANVATLHTNRAALLFWAASPALRYLLSGVHCRRRGCGGDADDKHLPLSPFQALSLCPPPCTVYGSGGYKTTVSTAVTGLKAAGVSSVHPVTTALAGPSDIKGTAMLVMANMPLPEMDVRHPPLLLLPLLL
jgi:hypothetical protein